MMYNLIINIIEYNNFLDRILKITYNEKIESNFNLFNNNKNLAAFFSESLSFSTFVFSMLRRLCTMRSWDREPSRAWQKMKERKMHG